MLWGHICQEALLIFKDVDRGEITPGIWRSEMHGMVDRTFRKESSFTLS
jgi:hypothetical protein